MTIARKLPPLATLRKIIEVPSFRTSLVLGLRTPGLMLGLVGPDLCEKCQSLCTSACFLHSEKTRGFSGAEPISEHRDFAGNAQ